MLQRRHRERSAGLGFITMSFDERGTTMQVHGRIVNHSPAGLCVSLGRPVPVGSIVAMEGSIDTNSGENLINRTGEVRWCGSAGGSTYRLGLKFDTSDAGRQQQAHSPFENRQAGKDGGTRDDGDYYDILQLSHTADGETINRVFRILAARYHPDNKDTGNDELFRKIVAAHKVLSDPVSRAAYDAAHTKSGTVRWRIFENAAVSTGMAAEKRKRTALLSALYTQRINDPNRPGISLRDLEQLLGCPCEHLEFAIWYLRQKQLISSADNGKLQITVAGIDAAEAVDREVVPASRNLLPQASET